MVLSLLFLIPDFDEKMEKQYNRHMKKVLVERLFYMDRVKAMEKEWNEYMIQHHDWEDEDLAVGLLKAAEEATKEGRMDDAIKYNKMKEEVPLRVLETLVNEFIEKIEEHALHVDQVLSDYGIRPSPDD